jgi:hypothetical protein
MRVTPVASAAIMERFIVELLPLDAPCATEDSLTPHPVFLRMRTLPRIRHGAYSM